MTGTPKAKFRQMNGTPKNGNSSHFWEIRGIGAAGSALEWHSRGQRFDPAMLHSLSFENSTFSRLFSCAKILHKNKLSHQRLAKSQQTTTCATSTKLSHHNSGSLFRFFCLWAFSVIASYSLSSPSCFSLILKSTSIL